MILPPTPHLSSLGFLLVLWFSLPAAAQEEATVQVAGLRIVGAPCGVNNELQPFSWHEGTTVALKVYRAQGGLIKFDEKASDLKVFADDQGHSLLNESGFMQGFGAYANTSADGRVTFVEVMGGGRPSAASRAIHLNGNMSFKVATTQETSRHENTNLKAGAKVLVGKVPLQIKSTGKPQWGEMPFEITFEASQRLDHIAEVRFLDGDGKEVESSDGGTLTMESFGKVQVEKSYTLAKELDSATIEFLVWTDLKQVDVPFDLVASVAF